VTPSPESMTNPVSKPANIKYSHGAELKFQHKNVMKMQAIV